MVIVLSCYAYRAYIFAMLSSTYIKRFMTDREGNAMLQKIEYFTGSMDSYFQSIEKSSQLLVYNEKYSRPLKRQCGEFERDESHSGLSITSMIN